MHANTRAGRLGLANMFWRVFRANSHKDTILLGCKEMIVYGQKIRYLRYPHIPSTEIRMGSEV